MDYQAVNEIFNAYCYGPADVVQIRKGDSTMWLTLLDSVGRRAVATYRGCVYWRLEQQQVGLHLSLVQRVTAEELLQKKDSPSVRLLKKNTEHVEQLLREWEDDGLNLYLHQSIQADTEFLVVARSLDYQEFS